MEWYRALLGLWSDWRSYGKKQMDIGAEIFWCKAQTDTWRFGYVASTPMQRHDVTSALMRRLDVCAHKISPTIDLDQIKMGSSMATFHVCS